MESEKLNMWCLVELFGHQKIAGLCTEKNIAGVNMLRVDVPATNTTPPFTRFFGGAAIYAINPIDEVSAIAMVNNLKVSPVTVWSIQSYLDLNKSPLTEIEPQTKPASSTGQVLSEIVNPESDEDDIPW